MYIVCTYIYTIYVRNLIYQKELLLVLIKKYRVGVVGNRKFFKEIFSFKFKVKKLLVDKKYQKSFLFFHMDTREKNVFLSFKQ